MMNDQTIIRIAERDRWLHMDVRPLEDSRLSYKAKGILAYLLGKPDDWTVRVKDITKRSTDGEHAVRSGLRELEKAGYLEKKQRRRQDGTFEPTEYVVHEEPLCGFPHADNPNVDNPDVENHHTTIDNPSTSNNNTTKDMRSPNGGDHKVAVPSQANFGMLARICKADLDTITPKMRGKLNQLEKLLREKKGVTAEDLKQFGIWWYKHYWKGKDGDAPRPMQIRDEWGKFESWHNTKRNEGVIEL
jgi:hypothetical protein